MQQKSWSCALCLSSYAPCRSLRKTVHAKLLINLCLALLGLYVTFVISTVSTGVPVLCGLISALMHYFFLAVFFWMAAEAIHLHRKLVTVFKPDITSYLAIAMALCWGRLYICIQLWDVVKKCWMIFHITFYLLYSCSRIHCDILTSSKIPKLHPHTFVSCNDRSTA